MLRRHPLLIPFWAMAAGLCLADSRAVTVPLGLPAALFCCLLLSCLIRNRVPLLLCSAAFFFTFGVLALEPYTKPAVPADDIRNFAARTPVIVEGIVDSRPTATSRGCSFVVRVEGVVREGRPVPTCGRMMLFVDGGDPGLARGDRVRCAARIATPHRLGLPGEFDYARHLAYREVSATGRVAAPEGIILIRGAAEDSFLRRTDLVARRLGDFIRDAVPDRERSSVLAALLVGDQKGIPDDLNDAYTRAGVNHILSISGFHVGIIAWFMVMATLFVATRSEFLALRLDLRRTALLIALPAMLLYLFLSGAAPATSRSVIMLATFVLALHAERETDPLNALLLAAFLLVVLAPPSLFDLSFQLSFLALWGIVIVVPPVMERIRGVPRAWQRNLVQFVAASLAATGATMVPVLFYFDQASLNGVLSNFLIVPILGYGAVLVGSCALPFVYLFPPAAWGLLWCAAQLTALSNRLVTLFARLPLLSFHGITRLDMACCICFMVLVSFLRRSRRAAALCALPPLLAVAAHVTTPAAADGRLHITMLSVGQGESLLVRSPGGETMLVDGGGYLHDTGRDFGRHILGPALWKLGVRSIDHLVLTHSHPDHMGGMPFLVRTFPVREFWEPFQGGAGDEYERLQAALAERHVPARRLAAGDTFAFADGVEVTVLSPPRGGPSRRPADDEMGMNDESLVFRLRYRSFSMLFTADAGFPAEERLLADRVPLASTVLKAGHHGSRFSTSEALLDTVSPSLVLISAGRDNSFGLPARQTLERLNRRGIRTWRTDRDGTIELTSDGEGWSVNAPYGAK
ncbi:DNA internalization-related competence protein ComEC/Rec2 [Geobacter sp. FeAm09]|uniref:DNA internalization-related competence protein ComEC/Rec2 n=1 Tax=Geobacter sp. FeAm09 TaxID=2597769 RepID=UPI0011EEF0CE|nr:DNA internalization-related competence protein ComEC/Rec2 [Geobacter sp. FeAm09]QEM68267.1 DNA internalization-related competence protein ComEC/Rec2 [Geobacter sp. FeAm09]